MGNQPRFGHKGLGFYLVSTGLLLIAPLVLAQTPTPTFADRLVHAAMERTQHQVTYDGAYHSIPYPGGDVPAHIGVCTDVIVRAYRTLGHDLQVLVHQDMKKHFTLYPKIWGLKKPDRNIDHRRVPNLRRFFERHGKTLPISKSPQDYQPGDLVTWVVNKKLPHIGIVVKARSRDKKRPLIVHNIGVGPVAEDMLFDFPITGHYRFFPK
jgi:hypothetical protein